MSSLANLFFPSILRQPPSFSSPLWSQQIEVLRSRHTEITSQLAATSDIELARQAEIGSLQKTLVERETEFVQLQNVCKQHQQQLTIEKNEVQRCQKEMGEVVAAMKLQVIIAHPPY